MSTVYSTTRECEDRSSLVIIEEHISTELGHNIKTAREHRGLRQEELADRLGLGRTSVTNIERGRQTLSVISLYKIADALGVQPWELLPGFDKPKIKSTRTSAGSNFEFIQRLPDTVNREHLKKILGRHLHEEESQAPDSD